MCRGGQAKATAPEEGWNRAGACVILSYPYVSIPVVMTSTEPKTRHPRNPALDRLTASFKAFSENLPLAIGIHKVIKERLPELEPQQLRIALRIHTASTRYLKAVSQSKIRFDLDGAPLGEVTEEQRRQALDMLKERFSKQAERHKAEQLAKQQQEKLQLLVEKFNARGRS